MQTLSGGHQQHGIGGSYAVNVLWWRHDLRIGMAKIKAADAD